jgi:hypothetical protein
MFGDSAMANVKWKDTAELIGIGAIVASLMFVGLQMRQEQVIARAQSLNEYIATGVDYRIAISEYSDILVKGNSGAQLDEVELHRLQMMMEAAEDRIFLQSMATRPLGFQLSTAELKFASFLYRNPAARVAWLQIVDDMERYVDPLRTPESLARTKADGSSAFRERIKAHLAKLDELYK